MARYGAVISRLGSCHNLRAHALESPPVRCRFRHRSSRPNVTVAGEARKTTVSKGRQQRTPRNMQRRPITAGMRRSDTTGDMRITAIFRPTYPRLLSFWLAQELLNADSLIDRAVSWNVGHARENLTHRLVFPRRARRQQRGHPSASLEPSVAFWLQRMLNARM